MASSRIDRADVRGEDRHGAGGRQVRRALGVAGAGAGTEHPGREPSWLQHDDLAFFGKTVIEEDLGNLRRFSGACWSLKDQARMLGQR